MKTFPRKGLGRIYVTKEEDIEKVNEIIKEMDEFEWEYLPDRFIAVFDEHLPAIYTHKFDSIDIDKLTARCWGRGIPIWAYIEE
jgi:DNA polymerase elongation subunit (family B)